MRFREALPLLPSVAIAILVGAYLWIDDAGGQHFRPAAARSDTESSAARPVAELVGFPQTESTSDNSTELAKLQQTVQALQSSNKSLSDQVGTLAARLDNLEKARAEIRELPRHRGRRR